MEEIADLVRTARKGEPDERMAAFGLLVKRFADMAVGYAYAILRDFQLAEDAAQEAFLIAYRRMGDLRRAEAFGAWFRMILRTAAGHVARRRRGAGVNLAACGDVAAPGKGPARAAQDREMKERVLAAIDDLPGPQREATLLFYINGYSQDEVARFLEVPMTTVNNRLAGARKRLKERFAAMVKHTLRDKAPAPALMRDRTEFVLGLAQQFAEGIPFRRAMETCRGKARTKQLKAVIGGIIDDIFQRRIHSLHEAMRRHPELFPPVVVGLVEDGETVGELDKTLRYAGQWLLEGRYEPDRFLFQRCMWDGRTIAQAQALGGRALTIRNSSPVPRTADSRPPEQPWAEVTLANGRTVHLEPDMFHVAHGVYQAMKLNTVLDARQRGDVQTGVLRTRPAPEAAAESCFRIRFAPAIGCGEACIDLTPAVGHEGQPTRRNGRKAQRP
ncbi:MAG: sigma-70 family RNA polymerase sigma factor [Planctomycetota bacterium]|nr:sigma-70 family RNA polymerase sigma factor [Planctomycetota bacterium]